MKVRNVYYSINISRKVILRALIALRTLLLREYMVYPESWEKPVVVVLFLASAASWSDCNVLSMLQIPFKMVVLTKSEITYSLNFYSLKRKIKSQIDFLPRAQNSEALPKSSHDKHQLQFSLLGWNLSDKTFAGPCCCCCFISCILF